MSDNMKKCLETVEDMMRLSSSILLNEKQCNNLVANFQKGVEAIQNIKKMSKRDVFGGVEQDLVRIVNKAKKVVDECCKEDWCRGAILQIDNKETFRELLLDLECCFHTMCDISRMCYRGQSQNILQIQSCTTFYPASIDEVEEDDNSLHRRLSKHLTMDIVEDRALAQYLLERVVGLQLARGEELDKIVFPSDYPQSHPSGRFDSPLGTTGTPGCVVLPTKWVGIESATKVIIVYDPQQKRILLKEASIMGGLNHPNIIKFFCCGFSNVEIEKFELVMERGKSDLCKFLDKEKTQITDAIRMDIMLQIASGMCYLHDMKVAHRDLKPSNVVVTSKDVSKSDGCLESVHVKLVDFGISKIKVKESPEVPTGQSCYGTVHYMAPEAFENRNMKLNAFKTDVFTFAMTSFEILTGEKPFCVFPRMDQYVKLIHDGRRPKLPKNCSKELKSLIHDCWSLDPSKRPTFLDICKTLRLLKSSKFKNVISMDEMLQHKEPSWSYDLLMNPKQWWTNFTALRFMPKIGEYDSSSQNTRNDPSPHQILNEVNNTMIESKRLIGIKDQIPQLEGQLHKIGRLGIVGTGGIGKSTLANALSVHISHQFDGTCFVRDFKGEACTFIFKLEDMQETPQVKKLVEARITMEHICKTKNILIVVDDVSKQIDLHQLLGDHIFKDVNGSKLIAISRDGQSFGQYIPKAGIVNMKILEGDKAMKLFCMHAFGADQSCEPYLKHVVEKIVKACCGFPLSLGEMGKCMHGERRLRIWERTMYRMLKGKYDGLSKLIAFGKLILPKCQALKHMPQGFGALTCLKKLNMWEYEALEVFPSELSNLIALEELNFFKYRALKHVREGFGTLTCLKKLGMWECEALEVFPSGLNNLKVLEELSFSKCRVMKHVPEGFGMLTSLKKLFMWECEGLDVFPCGLSNLVALEELEFSKCRALKYVPKGFGPFTRLKKLDMSECEGLEVFPSGLSNLIALEELNFSQCRALIHVPEGFGNLTCLKKLDMSECEALEVFPSGLSKLIALEELNFSQCRALKHVPEGFESLTRLKKLDMSECEVLEVFPSGLTKLTSLEELWSYQCPAFKHVSHGFGTFDIFEKT